MNKRLLFGVIVIAAMSAGAVMASGTAYAQSGEKFVLSGLIYIEGDRGLAWLQEPTYTNDKIIVARVGDSIGPYRLTKILDDQIELEGPGGKVAVPLAGAGGPSNVAAVPQESQTNNTKMPPHPALKNPDAIVMERGDPRRLFPAADLLIGAGAHLTPAKQSQATLAQTPNAAPDRGIVPPSQQTPPPAPDTPHPALQNPSAIVIGPGDPRRVFPASSLLIGAGAQVGTGTK